VTTSCASSELTRSYEAQTVAAVSKPILGLQWAAGNRQINSSSVFHQKAVPSSVTFQSYVKPPSTCSAMPPVVTAGYMHKAELCNFSSSSPRSCALNVIAPALPVTDNEILPVTQSSSIILPTLPQQNGTSLMDSKILHCNGNQGELLSKSNTEFSLEKQTVEQSNRPSWHQGHLQFISAKHTGELAVEHSSLEPTALNACGDGKESVAGLKTDSKLSRNREDLLSILTDRLFLHWTNSDALCWLDVAMAMIVHCQSLRHAVAHDSNTNRNSCIRQLLREYDRAQTDFRRSSKLNRCHYLCGQGKMVKLETSVGHITVKTGGGSNEAGLQLGAFVSPTEHIATIDVDDVSGIICDSDENTTSVERVSLAARRLDEQAKQILVDVREHVFSMLQDTMQCKRGQNDSALLALSSLLIEDAYISEQFLVKYSFSLKCSKCSHLEANR
jgi:hypothetical protein